MTLYADTIKIYTKAHGSKTTNLIINLDHPDWIMDDGDKTLESFGLGEHLLLFLILGPLLIIVHFTSAENEAELSFFNCEQYEAFLKNPETKWQ
jgi:Uncharacterized conserved protein (DUF2340)